MTEKRDFTKALRDICILVAAVLLLVYAIGGAERLKDFLQPFAVVLIPLVMLAFIIVPVLAYYRHPKAAAGRDGGPSNDTGPGRKQRSAVGRPERVCRLGRSGRSGRNAAPSATPDGIEDALRSLPGYKKLLRHVEVPRRDGSVAVIDTVMLHSSGIYVIQPVSCAGQIHGCETDLFWTCTAPDGQTERFYNPVPQNEACIKALMEYLGKPRGSFQSIVVFSNAAALKTVTLTSYLSKVLRAYELPHWFVGQDLVKVKDAWLKKKIDGLYQRLRPLTGSELPADAAVEASQAASRPRGKKNPVLGRPLERSLAHPLGGALRSRQSIRNGHSPHGGHARAAS